MSRYVQITEKRARILIKILELERQGITQAELVKVMAAEGIDKNVTYTFLRDAAKDSREFLTVQDWQAGRGRSTKLLGIDPLKFVTAKRTAVILLELAEFQTEETVSRERFVEHLDGKYNFGLKLIEERLAFLGWIGEIGFGRNRKDAMWVDWTRYHTIKEYLRLLAG